jgi:hypothetical protein
MRNGVMEQNSILILTQLLPNKLLNYQNWLAYYPICWAEIENYIKIYLKKLVSTCIKTPVGYAAGSLAELSQIHMP